MASVLICSNCGRKTSIKKNGYENELMIIANWGKLGNAYYCKHCIDTWKKRNNKAFEDREVTDIQTNTDTLHESIQKIIQKVSEDICDNYCKYRETSDEDCLCDVTRNGNQCPLDRLH